MSCARRLNFRRRGASSPPGTFDLRHLPTGTYSYLHRFIPRTGIVSIIDVIIRAADEQPYGILEIVQQSRQALLRPS